MKEENKDLPTQRQRLRDMQQEMIGLEHSVLTEETRRVLSFESAEDPS